MKHVVATQYSQRAMKARQLRRDKCARVTGTAWLADKVEGERVPVGMLTDRDITVAIVAPGLDANTMLVGDVISAELLSASEHYAKREFTNKGLADECRHH